MDRIGSRFTGCGKTMPASNLMGRMPGTTGQDHAGCSKSLSSKAAASEGPRRTLWAYVRGSERCENADGGLFQRPA